MTLVRRLKIACVLLAGVGLMVTFILNGRGHWSWIFLALSLFWWYGGYRAWPAVSFISMTGFFLFAVVGAWSGIHPLWLLLITAAVLAAWDLEGLERRLCQRPQDQLTQVLMKRHLRKLAAVIAGGILVGATATALQTRLSFWVVFFLSLLLALSLSRAYLLMRDGAENDSG